MAKDKKMNLVIEKIELGIMPAILAMGWIISIIAAIVDAVIGWIAVFTGEFIVSANTIILIIGIPMIGTPIICFMLLALAGILRLFLQRR